MIENSIIIPTAFDKCEELLKPCIESIIKFTDLSRTEIIVVANGCTDNTVDWCRMFREIEIVFFEEAIGYPAAINAGIQKAKGEFVIPLNNDTILLEQYKNCWIDVLRQPFSDPKMAITGPWMNWCPYAERDFLIFFCVMIRKSVLDVIGMLDVEAFSVGYGEDCDLCCKAQAAGFKIAQVPGQQKLAYDGRIATGQLPIYHAGNKTFANWPGGEKLLRKNREILKERYATNIGAARECDGFMSDEELRWLAQAARKAQVFLEIGCWHGRSTRAIADNLLDSGKLYAIDTWQGSKVEQDTNHASARMMDGDHAFDEFCRNLWDHIESGKVVPLRIHGKHAATLLQDMGIKADTIFIDGGHGPGETKADIECFLPLRKEGGIISGHDYMHEDGVWPDVGPEVKGIFGANIGQPPGTHIWYTDSGPYLGGVPPLQPEKIAIAERPRIYDCFTFFNELELLEIRLNELDSVVDRFVICEATKTHQGQPKPLYFQENMHRFGPFLHKITHIIDEFPDEMETGGGPSFPSGMNWARERHQREALMQALTECRDNDIIIVSDGDEIARAETIKAYKPEMGLMRLEQQLYYYFFNCYGGEWRESKILPYGLLKQMGPCNVRYSLHTIGTHGEPLWNAGWHFSFMGGPERVKQKIRSYSHGEYNRPDILEEVEGHIERAEDPFGREFSYKVVELNGNHPIYVQQNEAKFRELGFIK